MPEPIKILAINDGESGEDEKRLDGSDSSGDPQKPRSDPAGMVVHVVTSELARGHGIMEALSQKQVRCRIMSTTGPFDLLWKLERQPPNILILILPVKELEDFSFCQELRRNTRLKSIKVVVVDKSYENDRRRSALFFGVDLYLSEPLKPESIEAILEIEKPEPSTT